MRTQDMAKKQDIKKNVFTLRVSDGETLRLIEELLGSKLYESKNDLLNRALSVGAEELHAQVFLKKRKSAGAAVSIDDNTKDELLRKLEQIHINTEDTFVLLNILEFLIATLYNVEALERSGTKVSEDMMRSGLLSELPENLADVKKDIIERYARRNRK